MDVIQLLAFLNLVLKLTAGLDNLALSKTASQSSNLYEDKWLADTAVDGNGNQTLNGNSCACTNTYQNTVWWQVDLGNVYAMSTVKIFYRNGGIGYTFRLSGFKLYVTLQDDFLVSGPVYVDNGGVQSQPFPPANFTVTVATYGRYVTLYKDRSSSCRQPFTNKNICALFELCEVEVLGCPKTKYGTDCQSTCPVNCLYDACAISNGNCYGCKVGYNGDKCNQHVCTNCDEDTLLTCFIGLDCDRSTGGAYSSFAPDSIHWIPEVRICPFYRTCTGQSIDLCFANLAFSKTANQSSNLYEDKWLADTAVDGNGNQTLNGNSCACTNTYQKTVWWQVDLGNVYAMSTVKIFYRNEEPGYTFRLSGFKLYVTLQDDFLVSGPVYVDNGGVQSQPFPPANFTVTVATYGRYITLYKDRSGSCREPFINENLCALFELCEVEVLGCPKTKYGTDCQSTCPVNCLYDVCGISNGNCYGCTVGYNGDKCDQPCRSGTYGVGCAKSCSGNCKDGVTCDVRVGTCPSGCSPGYTGVYCNQTCSPGTFGPSCASKCGSCRNNLTCNYINGSCSTGCELGFTGQQCKTDCPFGKWGYDCRESCFGNCWESCNVRTGICNGSCIAGWKGDTCNEVCEAGKYGPNCLLYCGNCINNEICERQTGACAAGCAEGFKGQFCLDISGESASIGDLRRSFLIYVILTSLIICILVAVIISIICFLRKRISFYSRNNLNRNDFEFTASRNESGVPNKFGGDVKESHVGSSQESTTEKYEELGSFRNERNNYESLTKEGESTLSLNKATRESRDRLLVVDVGKSEKNYEELHAGPVDNTYEALRNNDNSKYGNV